MDRKSSSLVDIVRDFLTAHRILRRVAERQRRGELQFEEIRALVGDGEEAVLFRLKERSHALFRDGISDDAQPIAPGVLFDLAVGSLFHEAMKLRENFYQRASYGPKVRALRQSALRDTTGLLHEFEKILEGSALRLDESLQEAETLLGQTTAQFRLLLTAHAECGVVTRFLIEHADRVEDALGEDLDAVLAAVHGSAGRAHARAAVSYLESGFFGEAREACEAAVARGEPREEMEQLGRYASGMQAYLEGRFGDAVAELRAWLETSPPSEVRALRLALNVVSRVGQLVEGDLDGGVARAAASLVERLRARLGELPAAAVRRS
jgi:hypothetical protein